MNWYCVAAIRPRSFSKVVRIREDDMSGRLRRDIERLKTATHAARKEAAIAWHLYASPDAEKNAAVVRAQVNIDSEPNSTGGASDFSFKHIQRRLKSIEGRLSSVDADKLSILREAGSPTERFRSDLSAIKEEITDPNTGVFYYINDVVNDAEKYSNITVPVVAALIQCKRKCERIVAIVNSLTHPWIYTFTDRRIIAVALVLFVIAIPVYYGWQVWVDRGGDVTAQAVAVQAKQDLRTISSNIAEGSGSGWLETFNLLWDKLLDVPSALAAIAALIALFRRLLGLHA